MNVMPYMSFRWCGAPLAVATLLMAHAAAPLWAAEEPAASPMPPAAPPAPAAPDAPASASAPAVSETNAAPTNATGPSASTTTTTTTTSTGRQFADFKLIHERNIFDPNRQPASVRKARVRAAIPTKVESLALVGTLLSDKESYAFFDGSESKFRTVLKTSNSVAGLTLVGITTSSVKLLNQSNTVELPVGMHLKRQDEGEWELVAGTGTFGTSSSSSLPTTTSTTSSSSDSAAPAPSGSSPGEDEIIKRLMQKREQELSK